MRLLTMNGVTVNDAVCETPRRVAVTVTVCDVVTGAVVIVNAPEAAPAAIETENGVAAIAELELAREVEIPPGGAWPFRVTVPVTIVSEPPTTALGTTETVSN